MAHAKSNAAAAASADDSSPAGMLIGAFSDLQKDNVGLDVILASQRRMKNLFDDLSTTYKEKTKLLAGLQATALAYQRVHDGATRAVGAMSESASQMVTWLPKFKTLVHQGEMAP